MKLIYALFLLIFFSLQAMSRNSENKYVAARYVVLAQEIQNETANKYAQKYKMVVVSDVAGLINKVNLLGFNFQIQGPLSQERLREILVDCVEGLLAALNSNEEIRPFLKTYPFTAEGIKIGIFVRDTKGEGAVYYPWISVVYTQNSEMIYRKYDPESEYFQDKEVIEEPYADAAKIVKACLK